MFWGLVLQPGKKYTKVVETSFRLTTAVLDTSTDDVGIVKVFVEAGESKVMVGNLGMKANIYQIPLDLQFIQGDEISFSTAGAKCKVHLSGYLVPDEESFLGEESSDEEETEVPELVMAGKRKDIGGELLPTKKKKLDLTTITEASPESKKKKKSQESTSQVTGKNDAAKSPLLKTFVSKLLAAKEESDEEDSDFEEEEEDDDESGEEEEEEDDDDSLMEEEEEADSSEEEMEEEEIKPEPVVVASPKKNKKVNQLKNETPKVTTPKSEKKSKVNGMKMESPKTEVVPANKTPAKANKLKTEAAKTPKSQEKELNDSISKKTPSKSEKKKKRKSLAAEMNGESPSKITESSTSPAAKTPKNKPKVIDEKTNSAQKPTKVVKAGGLVVEDINIGSGSEVKNGRNISMYYEGRLKNNNKVFDKTLSGPPFKFRLGSGEVIKGWDVGIQGMKVGGKRKLTVPPHMAYGKSGAPPAIPPSAALVFEVELKGVN